MFWSELPWNKTNTTLLTGFWSFLHTHTQGGGGQSDGNRRQSEANTKDSSPEPDADLLSDAEEDEEEDEEKKAERLARRLAREVKMMSTKLVRLKEKERAARKERENLREAMKKNQGALKWGFCFGTVRSRCLTNNSSHRVELKKFKKLQREVDKMAAMMNDHDEDDDDEDAEPKEDAAAETEEEENETEEESDSEESEEESESDDSESEPEV